ncbi:MAG: hypothetical protein ACOYNN_17495 [Terrimicrobiaceae bacterium]
MAHFAELDINNKVIRVLTACNQDIANNGGELSEQAALHFQSLNKFSENGVKWVQTSYNNNFRKQYAIINHTFDFIKNKFIAPQPFASWSLDANDDWQAPIVFPTITTYGAPYENENGIMVSPEYGITWNEIGQKWIGKDKENNEFEWIPSSSSWISTGN